MTKRRLSSGHSLATPPTRRQLIAAAASPLMRYWSWPRVTSRALGQDMKQQGRRPTEVARAMTRPGSWIEVLPESGT
jgi:hypothetical protein